MEAIPLTATELRQWSPTRRLITVKGFMERFAKEFYDSVRAEQTAENMKRQFKISRVLKETEFAMLRELAFEINTKETRRERHPVFQCKNFEEYCELWGFKAPPKKNFRKGTFKWKMFQKWGDRAKKERREDLKQRLLCQLETAKEEGWYIIMDTLTVRRQHYKKAWLEKESSTAIWKKYFENFGNLIKTATYGSVREAQGKEKPHYYAGVIERGEKNGRLHMHVLHFCKEIPKQWKKCPNGRGRGYKREISKIKGLWNYGFSTPKAVRYGRGDAWGKLGFSWPEEKKTRLPMPEKPIESVAYYITKYVTKTLSMKIEGDVRWRTKKSQKLGEKKRQEIIQTTIKRLRKQNPEMDTESLWMQSRTLLEKCGMKISNSRMRMNYLKTAYFPSISREAVSELLQGQQKTWKLGDLLETTTEERQDHRQTSFGNEGRSRLRTTEFNDFAIREIPPEMKERLRREALEASKDLKTIEKELRALHEKATDTWNEFWHNLPKPREVISTLPAGLK